MFGRIDRNNANWGDVLFGHQISDSGFDILLAEDAPIVTEAIDNESLELVEKYADVIQIGARNMQNFSLLKRLGKTRKPVLLKRGMSATLEELLLSA